MDLLIVAATKLEIPSVIQFSKKQDHVDVLISGIGGVATSYALTKALAKKKYDLLIQAGIAGSFSKEMALGTTVVVGADCFGDLGVVENKERKSVFDLHLLPADKKPFSNGWLVNPHKRLLKATGLKTVRSVTVNEISTDKRSIAYFGTKLEAVTESMEGAAFHYVALQEKVPFLQIRSLSNRVGERNKARWQIKESVLDLNQTVLKLVHEIRNK
ncbi:futalosine hydrolase [Niabella ginsenosidivorans]|uniref:Futalosine hydrolase n=1 Tax=Niabella ginsenosidivorans TaxID=1176587 RepID=A0A1A9HWU0_9BACT|nr:futalosine hydrolase [Niabella ginsenosidivorans]ANH79878.1 futalosine hydrolase [Niabella ginsenosidivorans]